MNYLHSHRLRPKALNKSALACLLVFILISLLLLPGLPKTIAARATSSSRGKSAQQAPAITFVGSYRQTNLVSNLPGVALIEDRLLSNPWGIALNSTSPFWVVNNTGDRATLYQGDVSGSPLVSNSALPSVAIPNVPTLAPAPSQPTGVVANTTNDFSVSLTPTSPAAPAQFIFVTLNGGINAWQPGLGSVAVSVKFLSGHSYTGLAIGNNTSGNLLYAADFANGKIDVFDKDFNLTSVSGNFTDASIPANFYPYNIQNLGGALYVTYAQSSFGLSFDLGFVRKFDTNGVRDTAFTINNGPLNSPWGMAIAPPSFGAFSNALLVGNNHFGNGFTSPIISAFNPSTGALIGHMVDGGGGVLRINDLWGLTFGNGVNGGDPNTLYFSAGSSVNHYGLFGSLTPIIGVPSTIKFSDLEYHTSENAGHIDITVTRSGVTASTATVNYATVDGGGTQKSDYEIALGKLTFNPGETSKTFRVLVVDDKNLAGGSSADLNLVLSNATGAELTSPDYAYLYLMDDEGDTQGQPPNILDDTQFFVRQQYFDFLNREPDTSGFNFWVSQINSCGTDQQCIELKKINVSAAFFLSIEFQKTGMLAYLTERAAFGGLPRYGPFMHDVQALQKDFVFGAPGASAQLEANTRAFFKEFITRPEFVAKYGGLSNAQYVDALLLSAEISTSTGRLFITRLDGSQVVPPTSTSAFGVAIARLSLSSIDTVNFSLSFKNLSSLQTAAHIHGPALAGSNAPELLTLPNGEFANLTVTLAAQQGQDMRSGRLYLDVHTQNNPDGEIRGQISFIRFQRDVLVDALNDGTITRAEALRLIAEDGDFRQSQLNRAFVLMEYFGYLRRNPDDFPDNNLDGFNFWLAKLNQFNGNFVSAEMVKAFLKSTEYRGRFGPP